MYLCMYVYMYMICIIDRVICMGITGMTRVDSVVLSDFWMGILWSSVQPPWVGHILQNRR